MVSVVVPFLDPPAVFFREALESVVRQTLQDWELVLVDDGSSSAARGVAKEFTERFPDRVRIVGHPGGVNRGIRESRRAGYVAAQGRYIALLDADDRWTPGKLEAQVAHLKRHPRAGMVYGRSLYWRSWQGRGKRDFAPELGVPSGKVVEPPALLPLFLSGSIAVPCPSTILVDRKAAETARAFEGGFGNMYEDQVFLSKMCVRTPVLVIDECWLHYRIHSSSVTSAVGQEAERMHRRRFLLWLDAFLEEQELRLPLVRAVIQDELCKLDRPARARVGRFVRKWSRRLSGRTIAPELTG